MDINEYMEFAVGLARQAGALIKENFDLGMKKQWKADNSPVTVTDLTINTMVVESVKKQYPEMGVIGEEESHDVKGADLIWVCDPVDGTVPFSHGIPTCMFSLALVKDGKPILGVLYDPFMDRLFTAIKGEGAFLNGQPIHVSDQKKLEGTYAAAGYSLFVPELYKRTGKSVLNLMSYCYISSLVASGEISASVCWKWAGPWDVAACKIIVEEAGGTCTDLDGKEQRYDGKINGAIVSNGHVHDETLAVVREVTK